MKALTFSANKISIAKSVLPSYRFLVLSSANMAVEFALTSYGDVAGMTGPRAFKYSLYSSLVLVPFAVSFTSGGGV